MKNTDTIDGSELPNTVLSAIEEIIQSNVNKLVENYVNQLRTKGLRIDPGDIIILKKAIRSEKMVVTMKVSSSIVPKLLEDYNIYPVLINSSASPEHIGGDDE